MSTLENFRHATPIQVRWADLDALGHVNNAKFLTYLEQARIGYFATLALWDGNPDKLGLIMARVTLDYKLPLFANDSVTVYTRCSRFGNRSFDTEQWVVRHKTGEDEAAQVEIAAQATITGVVFDYRVNRSAQIPDDWRERIRAYEPGPISTS